MHDCDDRLQKILANQAKIRCPLHRRSCLRTFDTKQDFRMSTSKQPTPTRLGVLLLTHSRRQSFRFRFDFPIRRRKSRDAAAWERHWRPAVGRHR